MRLRLLISGISRNPGGITLLTGVAAILAGVERLFSTGKPARAKPGMAPLATPKRRTDYFTIRQTRSEFGYVYWVLQGHGRFSSFTLFDTWREAIDSANTRLEAAVLELALPGS